MDLIDLRAACGTESTTEDPWSRAKAFLLLLETSARALHAPRLKEPILAVGVTDRRRAQWLRVVLGSKIHTSRSTHRPEADGAILIDAQGLASAKAPWATHWGRVDLIETHLIAPLARALENGAAP